MAKINFGGVVEEIVTRKEFPLKKALQVLKGETIAVLGYGVQAPAQALNLKDNGFKVIIGARDFTRAKADGWKPGKDLFSIEEAAKRGTVLLSLVSDAGQAAIWPIIKPHLTPGKALGFSHGFAIEYRKLLKIDPPKGVDIILAAPKGSGLNVRRNFLSGAGINSSYGVWQDATGRAMERAAAVGIGIGSGFLFPTTFSKEVVSDLTGERGVLMGALAGIIDAQYEVLRKNGHSPSEAFNETVEELTQSLIRLVDERGMDWMYGNCSTTAQRGALDWRPKFKKATLPVFNALYKSVKTGAEARRVIRECSGPDYKQKLDKELKVLRESELWTAGAEVRKLRPNEKAKVVTKSTKGVAGRQGNK